MWKRFAPVCLVAVLAGCLDEQVYLGPTPGESIFAFAMTEDTPPYISTDEAALYLVETRVEIPIAIPDEEELAELQAQAVEPYGRMPWVGARDFAIEVDLAVTNLMDEGRRVTLTANGISEFHEYEPGVTLDDDDVIPNFSQWERNVEVASGETFTWTIRQEVFDEMAVDLATIANGAPNPNQVVYFENHSSTDVRARPFIPEVVAGLVGFRMGMAAQGASNLVFEASVRIRDGNDRLADIHDPETWWPLPAPLVFSGAPAMMP